MSRRRKSALANVPVNLVVSQDAPLGDITALLEVLVQRGMRMLPAAPGASEDAAPGAAADGDVTPLKLHAPEPPKPRKRTSRRKGKPKRPAPASPPKRQKGTKP